MTKMSKILFIGGLLALLIFKYTTGQEACDLPSGEEGFCVPINECPVFKNTINRTSEERILFKDALCDSEIINPKVCCIIDDDTSCSGPGVADSLLNEVECGFNQPSNKTMNGKIAKLTDYAWLVLIEYEKNGVIETSCGGSLISRQYVLTAALCVINLRGRTPVNIRLGEFDRSNDEKDCIKTPTGEVCNDGNVVIPINKIIAHLEYYNKQRLVNDIALIRMSRPAVITDFVRTICLPKFDISKTLDERIKTFEIAGWGNTAKNRQRRSKIKIFGKVPFVNTDDCVKSFTDILRDRQICAGGDGNIESCSSDTGGPLMYRNGGDPYILSGIFSYGGSICALEGVPNVYTNTFAYLNWIKCNMQP